MTSDYSERIETARQYYNSSDADTFYHEVWGGEDLHIGVYQDDRDTIVDASQRTVEIMAAKASITNQTMILDVGAGYGGSARWLAKRFGCKVTCLNLSEVENDRNRTKSRAQGLDHLVSAVDGSFDKLPFPDETFDIVWSQDAFLHGDDRGRIVKEVARVLRSRGQVVFTDIMAAEGVSPRDVVPVLERVQLSSLASKKFYHDSFAEAGLSNFTFDDRSEELGKSYSRVLDRLVSQESEFKGRISEAYVSNMKRGLQIWIDSSRKALLSWGIMVVT